MESIIEQILTLVTGSPEFGAFFQMIYFFAMIAELFGMSMY